MTDTPDIPFRDFPLITDLQTSDELLVVRAGLAKRGKASLFTNPAGSVIASVPEGGTGLDTLPSGALLVGNGQSAIDAIAPGSEGQILKSQGGVWAAGDAPASTANHLEFPYLDSLGNWHFRQATPPALRPNSSTLLLGDTFERTTDGSAWFYNGSYWLSKEEYWMERHGSLNSGPFSFLVLASVGKATGYNIMFTRASVALDGISSHTSSTYKLWSVMGNSAGVSLFTFTSLKDNNTTPKNTNTEILLDLPVDLVALDINYFIIKEDTFNSAVNPSYKGFIFFYRRLLRQ